MLPIMQTDIAYFSNMTHEFVELMNQNNRCRDKTNKMSRDMKKYRCEVCDWIYDPAKGDPDAGIAPGTAFEDLPDDWVCPICGVGKDDFVEV